MSTQTTKKQVYFLVKRLRDGRYLGNSVWTFDANRALHFTTKQDADNATKIYSGTKVCLQ